MTRHFLRDDDLSPAEQAEVLALAAELKQARHATLPLAGPQTVAVVFDKPTLRTQLSFATGISELGGYPMVVDGSLARIGTRESVADVARVLGRQAAMVVWRTFEQSRIDEMAAYAGVPVINALTDQFHPCQLLADLQTVQERLDSLAGRTMTFLGDAGSNMAHSMLLAGTTAGMHVRVSGPDDNAPDPEVLSRAADIAATTGGSARYLVAAAEAVAGADVVATDTWVSMGKEEEADRRLRLFGPYSLDGPLLALASPDVVVLHCLPAYRGKEIAADVIDGPNSAVWDEAENRLHAQKALMTWLLAHQDGPREEER
ncbi:ornithine carbamoyltransferase [soil metagenome]